MLHIGLNDKKQFVVETNLGIGEMVAAGQPAQTCGLLAQSPTGRRKERALFGFGESVPSLRCIG